MTVSIDEQIDELKRQMDIADTNMSRKVAKGKMHPGAMSVVMHRLKAALVTLQRVQAGELVECAKDGIKPSSNLDQNASVNAYRDRRG